MKTRTALLIVAATAGVFAVGFLLVVIVGRTAHALREAVSSETARQQFVAAWQPPVRLERGLVFPERVHGFVLQPASDSPAATGIAPLAASNGIAGPNGLHARYERPGRDAVEVFAAIATPPEGEALAARVKADLGSGDGLRTALEFPGRWRVSRESPAETVEVWSIAGWVFRFRAAGELEADFIRDYLRAIRGRSAVTE